MLMGNKNSANLTYDEKKISSTFMYALKILS